MSIFAVSDLHLDDTGSKSMDIFGQTWVNHWDKIKKNWTEQISDGDLVLIAGDISWAMRLSEALADFTKIDGLPGKKVLIKGNHDYWHDSLSKTRAAMPKSMYFLQNDVYEYGGICIAGSRLWKQKTEQGFTQDDGKIYARELTRLRLSLEASKGRPAIVMTHYPPYAAGGGSSEFTELISRYNVIKVIYGHIHGKECQDVEDVVIDGISYELTSCDHLGFSPKKIAD